MPERRQEPVAYGDSQGWESCRAQLAARSEQPTIFVIDDNADVRNGLKQLVESIGLRCEVFASPNDFLRHSLTSGPSSLVVDVRLPEMNGLDLLARLGKNLPTIMITGHGDIPMAASAMQTGAVNFLTNTNPQID
jgi:FixJ family two-component response regulator